jgi:TonB-dependent starch-binding outer membrane protein SusC
MTVKQLLSFLFFFLAFTMELMAQVNVSGVVLDADTGEPLIGVTIAVKGATSGTITDVDGKFTISVQNNDLIIVVSYIGYRSTEIRPGIDLTINLPKDINQLDEVVVVGYGLQKRSDLTGSLSGIKTETIMESQSANLFSAIQGRMAGVQLSMDSGQPGSGMNLIVRGQTSINGTSSPLFVIDGVQIDVNYDEVASTGSTQSRTNPLNGINPADIESIEVLKDASATAIYGSRGANGVVIVTTKGGVKDRTVVDYTYNLSASQAIKKMPILTPEEYLVYQQDRGQTQFLNEDTNKDGIFETPRNFSQLRSSNWQDEGLRTAMSHQHQLNIRGGSRKTDYSAGLGYFGQEGIVLNNNYDQYNFRLRLKTDATERLSLGLTSNASYSVLGGVANTGGPGSFQGVTQQLLTANPWDITSDDVDLLSDGFISPISLIKESDVNTNIIRLISSANIDYKITDHLKFTSVLGVNVSNSKTKEFFNSNTSWGVLVNGMARLKEVGTYSYNFSPQVHYNKSFGRNHKIDAVGAFETYHYNFEDFGNIITGFEDQTTGVNAISKGTVTSSYTTQRWNSDRLSYLGRVNYNLFERYLITASIRADGSDKFGPQNRWGYFPSAALGWRVSDEEFMEDLETISNLKLRLSYGATGNERIPAYTYLAQLDPAFYASSDKIVFGLASSSLPNPNLKWEVTNQFNAGLDLGLFDGKLSITADVYQKITTDLLLRAPIPAQSGFTSQWQNLGRIDNYGLELQVSTVNYDKNNFTWKTDFNITFNRNKVKELGRAAFIPIRVFGDWQENMGRVIVDQPIGTMFGYVFDGIYQIEEFTWQNGSDPNIPHANRTYVLKEGLPKYAGTAAPGRMRYKDLDSDGLVNDNDRQVIGESNPLHFGGINNIFSYKNFDLSVFLQWSYGNELYNAAKVRLNSVQPWMNISKDYFDNHWTPEKQGNTAPAYGAIDQAIASSYYVEDGSYLRLRTVSMGYELPKKLSKKMGFSSLKFNLIGNNLLTWTKYTGWDPEVNFNNPLISGLDRIAYPRAKTFTFSINTTF